MKNTVSLPRVNSEALAAYAESEGISSFAAKPSFSKLEKAFLVSLVEDVQSLNLIDSMRLNFSPRFPVLGTSSAKTEKGETKGWLTGICYLSPAKVSGFFNLCAWAGNCKALCLDTAGKGGMDYVQKQRKLKTARLAFYGPEVFLLNAILDLRSILVSASNKGYSVAVRLDGTSDIGLVNYPLQCFGNKSIAEIFPSVSFYEYTKSAERMLSFLRGEMLPNVHFTFSHDGENNVKNALNVERILKAGGSVAVCFSGSIPETWKGYPVINGDETDLRFLDRSEGLQGAFIVGLKAKGKAKKVRNGFVVESF